VIGGLDPEYEELEFVHLPLVDENLTSWSIDVQSLIWGDGSSLRQDLDNCTATFSSSIPWIFLPGRWADKLLDLIGATRPMGMFIAFPFSNRPELPDLTFILAGQTVSLSPFEYSFEMIFSPGADERGFECVVGFDDAEEDTVVLGWSFLQNFVAVFDQDEREVKCEYIFEQYVQALVRGIANLSLVAKIN
jgi:hypothetical protein